MQHITVISVNFGATISIVFTNIRRAIFICCLLSNSCSNRPVGLKLFEQFSNKSPMPHKTNFSISYFLRKLLRLSNILYIDLKYSSTAFSVFFAPICQSARPMTNADLCFTFLRGGAFFLLTCCTKRSISSSGTVFSLEYRFALK